jgi:hypothetical protein
MYNSYLNYIRNITQNTISTSNFKSNKDYNGILEHVSKEQGEKYIKLINEIVTSLFPEITIENIKNFLIINDKYGYPHKETFTFSDKSIIMCSPTSLRYIYHSLLILNYYKLRNDSTNIVEVGCGYGGLFLGICYFSKILAIRIDHYYFIDLPEICILINNYISLHKDIVNISYSTHSAFNYGSEIDNTKLFLISNYCFTEIQKEYRDKYITFLFPKVVNGFIIWQTVFNLPITQTHIMNKKIYKITEEQPQTASVENKNYFVCF